MTLKRLFCAIALSAVLAGCGSSKAVREARHAQRMHDVAEMSSGKTDLRGCSLEQLVDFALTNRPSMARARLAVRDARLALREIAADAPLISSTPWGAFDASASVGRSESSKAGRSLHGPTAGAGSGALSLDVLIYDFGRNKAAANAAAEEVIAAEVSLLDAGYSVFEDVSTGYFVLLRNEALLEVAVSNVAEYAEHLAQAEMRMSCGEAKEIDVLMAKLDLANSVQDAVAASNDVKTAGADLMAALGVDAASGDFRDVLGEINGGLPRMKRAFATTSGPVAEIFGFASTNALSMQIARTRLKAASYQVDAAIANLYPTISANLSLDWTDPRWYWRWGANVAKSLFTGGRKTTAVKRATVALDSAAHNVKSTELDLSREVEVAVAERDNAGEALVAARLSVRRAKENLDTVREQYNIGEADRIDYTAAAAGYASALGDLVRSFYRGQMAEAKLFRVAGRTPEYREETTNEE